MIIAFFYRKCSYRNVRYLILDIGFPILLLLPKKIYVLVTVIDPGDTQYPMFAYQDRYGFCLDFCTRLSRFLSICLNWFYVYILFE